MATTMDTVREKALQDYRKKLLEHKEVESRLKESKTSLLISFCSTHYTFISDSRYYYNRTHQAIVLDDCHKDYKRYHLSNCYCISRVFSERTP